MVNLFEADEIHLVKIDWNHLSLKGGDYNDYTKMRDIKLKLLFNNKKIQTFNASFLNINASDSFFFLLYIFDIYVLMLYWFSVIIYNLLCCVSMLMGNYLVSIFAISIKL